MSSGETIVHGRESGGIQGYGNSEPSTSTRTRGSSKRARVSSSSATRTERAIPNKPLLHNLARHPSKQAKDGKIPTKNLNFRGAWPTAFNLYHKAHDEYRKLFDAAGFAQFLEIRAVHIPQAYAIALRERWFSETNTLHLPSFEIGPTPLDWAMITGLNFGGDIIRVKPDYDQDRALQLLGVGRDALTDGKICLSKIVPTDGEVQAQPENDEAKGRIFRRLFLYVVGSCFFSNNRSVIHHGLVQYLEAIDKVRSYDWAAVTFAAFLYGMRRQVTGENGSFTGFWPFLVFWAFEYIKISRPGHTGDQSPRAMRWICPESQPGPLRLDEVLAFRLQLSYVTEDQVEWQPYLSSDGFGSRATNFATELSRKRMPFQSLATWEYYLGERCRRQLGLLCRIPHPPPKNMHGTCEDRPEDPINVGRSAESLVMDTTVTYQDWFTKISIGKIVDVDRLLGGPNTAGPAIDDWLATHRPDMQLVLKSEYEELKEAHAAAIAELSAYREDRRATSDSSLNERHDGD